MIQLDEGILTRWAAVGAGSIPATNSPFLISCHTVTRKSEDEIDSTLPEQTARIVRRPVSSRHKAGIDARVMINKKGDGRRSAFKNAQKTKRGIQ